VPGRSWPLPTPPTTAGEDSGAPDGVMSSAAATATIKQGKTTCSSGAAAQFLIVKCSKYVHLDAMYNVRA
jgi:hypothetical protein